MVVEDCTDNNHSDIYANSAAFKASTQARLNNENQPMSQCLVVLGNQVISQPFGVDQIPSI